MTRTKEISISVDLDELERQLDEQLQDEEVNEGENKIRSTVFSFGKDPRLASAPQVSTPDLVRLEIMKDGLDNPFVELNWRISRSDVDAAGVIGFNVFRRRIDPSENVSETFARKQSLGFLSRRSFDRISKKTPRRGRFSSERKSITNIRRSLVPKDILNANLHSLEAAAQSRYGSFFSLTKENRQNRSFENPINNLEESLSRRGKFENFFAARKFEKLSYVDYSKFLAKEKNKFVFVTDREFVDLSFRDKKIGYGEAFEYYVSSVTSTSQDGPHSNSVKVEIIDLSPIRPPKGLTAKQLNENEVEVSVMIEPQDDISLVHIFRKDENDIDFEKIVSTENVRDIVSLVDHSVKYGGRYTYRVFLENIYGTISQPRSIDFESSVQKITPQSRSNNLKIPILTAVQDQNSDFIKITISSNDPNVSYYELERKDLTIHERRFAVPSKNATNYGGTGWITNKFFVDRNSQAVEEDLVDAKDVLNRRTIENEIVFIDDTVTADHIYQYRIFGCDLFCNKSSYALATVRASGKRELRSPVNLRAEVLRGNPYRVKITWKNDNEASIYEKNELFEVDSTLTPANVKTLYRLQRRKKGEKRYLSFPLTANNFVIDEVPTNDAVDFDGKKTSQIVSEPIERVTVNGESTTLLDRDVRRPFQIPDFLSENDIYFYRVAAVGDKNQDSNFTPELEVSTLAELSKPVEFSVTVLNTKVFPLVGYLSWSTEISKARPDHWVIERKFDVDNDTFEVIGRSYLESEFFDRDLDLGDTYVYRIKSVDTLGRESEFVESRLTL